MSLSKDNTVITKRVKIFILINIFLFTLLSLEDLRNLSDSEKSQTDISARKTFET
jgi:hypothetical protein